MQSQGDYHHSLGVWMATEGPMLHYRGLIPETTVGAEATGIVKAAETDRQTCRYVAMQTVGTHSQSQGSGSNP